MGIVLKVVGVFLAFAGWATAANFTTGGSATKHGTHEIVLQGPSNLADPFDVNVDVTFSTSGQSIKTYAFYDGGGVWKARCFVTKAGSWNWSTSSTQSQLHGKSGTFSAVDSSLPGKLRTRGNRPGVIENSRGEWFTMLGDTGYYMFSPTKSSLSKCQSFVNAAAGAGLNVIRANIGGSLRSEAPLWYKFANKTITFDVNVGKFDDACLQWMLNNKPGMYVQLIPIPEYVSAFDGMTTTGVGAKVLRYMVGRYGAYSNVFWLLRNDTRTPLTSGLNTFGAALKQMDPWNNLRATGHTRGYGDPLWVTDWTNYSHLETQADVAGQGADGSLGRNKYTWCGEDWYETYPSNMSGSYAVYFFRRLFWAYVVSGGGACYGGYWDKVAHMGSGMQDLKYVMPYFRSRNIDLGNYAFDKDTLAVTSTKAIDKAHVAYRGNSDFIIFDPNGNGLTHGGIGLNAATASFTMNLASGAGKTYRVEWFNCDTGASSQGANIAGGGTVTMTSPFGNRDVVCRIWDGTGGGVVVPPPEPTPDTQKPTVPTGISATALSSGSIKVSWTASTDNVGVVAYDVYLGSNKVGNTASTSFTNSGLSPATAYTFKVQARDLAGNLSDFSSTVTATTQSGAVEPPPTSGGTVYQAEAAVVSGCVKYGTYVDYINNSGDYIEWTVNAPTAGNYSLGFTYAFGSGNRPLEIKANGSVVAASLAFPGTGSTTNYQTVTTQAALNAGVNKIRATAIGSSGGNMDSLTVNKL